MAKPPRKVREPVQAYLDSDDKALLEDVAEKTGLAQAEILRRGLRRIAHELVVESAPGSSLNQLIGALDGVEGVPPDLSARHDEYLYPDDDA